MSPVLTRNAAQTILSAFIDYQEGFERLTQNAQRLFEERDWAGMQGNAVARLNVYRQVVDGATSSIRHLLGTYIEDKQVWAGMKADYSTLIGARPDHELGETFFNSITRRIFSTVGVDPCIEFVLSEFQPPAIPLHYLDQTPPICRAYRPKRAISTSDLVAALLRDCGLRVPFACLEEDAALVAERIHQNMAAIERIDILKPLFFRNRAAYVIGRIVHSHGIAPLILALLHEDEGVYVDAALLSENDASIVFSFTRSYFHVDMPCPVDVIMFLKSIMPRKRLAELYIAVGHNKHGKTLLYRDLIDHLSHSDDQFEIAPGERGMVMLVFTLPSYDMVFKVIKDHFDYPKRTTRQQVKACYDLVFQHDRAGRLVDAQEFEHLEFDRQRFSEALLRELADKTNHTVQIGPDRVAIAHVYMERRLTPLNLYLGDVADEAAVAAALDYGQAIKDLAASAIFPGDLFLKNFGVTRHGRVVFYDYDELQLLTTCRFRRMPPPRNDGDEFSAEPWFSVQEHDVFPEQFPAFLGLRPELKAAFMQRHADLFDIAFWRAMQEQHLAGQTLNIYPYQQRHRLPRRQPAGAPA